MKQILLVEDDPDISISLKMSLGYKKYQVTIAHDLASAHKFFSDQNFDLLILDVNLPDGMSFTFCNDIRKQNANIPIIMLTALIDEESAVQGMASGADDYVRKPFGINELLMRISKLLERSSKSAPEFSFGPLKIDPKKRQAWVENFELSLGKKEYEILLTLVRKQGEVLTRNEILNVFGEEAQVFDRCIDSHLSHLRKKLRAADAKNILITPVYGVGYRLDLR
ncbi:MAG: response regulator transcription factor [Bdellovibrionota bacterium]